MRNNLNISLDEVNRDITRIRQLLTIYPNHKDLKKDLKRLNRIASYIQAAIELLPSEPYRMPTIAEIVARFGAVLTDTGRLISPKGKETAITIKQSGEHVSYIDTKGNLLNRHMFSPHLVENFIEKNWNWKRA